MNRNGTFVFVNKKRLFTKITQVDDSAHLVIPRMPKIILTVKTQLLSIFLISAINSVDLYGVIDLLASNSLVAWQAVRQDTFSNILK